VRAAYGELRRNRFRGRARWQALTGHLGELSAAVCASLEGLERAAQIDLAFEPTSDATFWPAEASNGR
jgi:hypothetical protein